MNLTQNVARELAPLGVRVNALCPGFFPAEQNRKILDPARVEKIMRQTPMARFGEPHELVGATLLLLSESRRELHHRRDLLRRRRLHGHEVLRMSMPRSSVTVSLVPEARGGPFVFWDDLAEACRKARALGFDAVESFLHPPPRSTVTCFDRSSTTTGWCWPRWAPGRAGSRNKLNLTLPEASDRMKARDFIRSIIDFAGAFGAPAIIGSMQGRSSDRVDPEMALGYLCDALKTWANTPTPVNVPLIYEPLNRYETNMAKTLDAGLNILDRSRPGTSCSSPTCST